MDTAADFRREAKDLRRRALTVGQPAAQAMLLAMAAEFDRDAKLAAREERRACWRKTASALEAPPPAIRAA